MKTSIHPFVSLYLSLSLPSSIVGEVFQMGRKLGLASFFGVREIGSSSSSSFTPWPWPSCKHPRTLSFRVHGGCGDVHKGISSGCLDSTDSCFTNSSRESESFSTASEDSGVEAEAVIRGLRSDRLFFKPGGTSSILEEAKPSTRPPFEGGVAMELDSKDPYRDFRASMEEMVLAHGVKDVEWLKEMLGWYLRVNGRGTHGLIVGAFLDLLVMLSSLSPSCSSSSPSSF